MKDLSLKMRDLHVSHTLGCTGDCKSGTPKDRDEVNRREVYECDGWVCDLEVIGVSSIFKLIRKDADLSRMLPTFDMRCEENADGSSIPPPLPPSLPPSTFSPSLPPSLWRTVTNMSVRVYVCMYVCMYPWMYVSVLSS